MIHKVAMDERINQIPALKEFLKLFLAPELMRWPKVSEVYGQMLRATFVFADSEDGRKRWEDLHSRVIEHVRSHSLITLC